MLKTCSFYTKHTANNTSFGTLIPLTCVVKILKFLQRRKGRSKGQNVTALNNASNLFY